MVHNEVVACPVCEARYKVLAAPNGKLRLEDFVINGNDPGSSNSKILGEKYV